MSSGGRREGAGRPKGSKNKVPPQIRELAQEYTEEALGTHVSIMRDLEAPAAARAHSADSILAYGHGKPRQQIEHTGANGGPIETSVEDRRAEAMAAIDAAFAEHQRREAEVAE